MHPEQPSTVVGHDGTTEPIPVIDALPRAPLITPLPRARQDLTADHELTVEKLHIDPSHGGSASFTGGVVPRRRGANHVASGTATAMPVTARRCSAEGGQS
jgi:hypothetical protein